jgi:hypothetical protein
MLKIYIYIYIYLYNEAKDCNNIARPSSSISRKKNSKKRDRPWKTEHLFSLLKEKKEFKETFKQSIAKNM